MTYVIVSRVVSDCHLLVGRGEPGAVLILLATQGSSSWNRGSVGLAAYKFSFAEA